MDSTEHLLQTRSGRVLKVKEGGDPSGTPVFTLHGTPASRLLYSRHLEDALDRGIRLIGYDRPGYGESSSAFGRKIADAAEDVATIADGLDIPSFGLWGISGGGPHALACAALLPERAAAVATLASVAPDKAPGLDFLKGAGQGNLDEFNSALRGANDLEPYLQAQRTARLQAGENEVRAELRSLLSPADSEVFTGGLATYLGDAMSNGLKSGVDGWRDDDLAFIAPWGFDLAKIRVPVALWHGMQDLFVPFSHGVWLAEHIPKVTSFFSETDGHLTLIERRIPDVHAWILRQMPDL